MRHGLGNLFQIEGGQSPFQSQGSLAKTRLYPFAPAAKMRMPVQLLVEELLDFSREIARVWWLEVCRNFCSGECHCDC